MPFLSLYVRLMAVGLALTLGPSAGGAASAPKPIILDTDFETDVDDVSALALLHALADRGEVTILAVMVAGTHADAAPAIATVNAWFGRPEIPIGVRPAGRGVARKSSYTRALVERFGDGRTGFASADSIGLYRRLLSSAEDDSVTIVSIGYLTNLADLIVSPGDAENPSTGAELVARKVQRYVCMGGDYPRQSRGGRWGNFLPDPESAIRVSRDWPTPLVFTGGGDFARSVPVGAGILATFPPGHLVRHAYEVFFAGTAWARGPDHHSADLIAVYIAARGVTEEFVERRRGYNHIFPDGTMEWREESDRTDRSYVAELASHVDGRELGREFEALIASARHRDAP